MEKYSQIILNFGNTVGKYSHTVLNFGNLMGKCFHDIHNVGIRKEATLFPKKSPVITSWESTASQKYPKYGIPCLNFFPIIGNFPIYFPTGNFEKFPVADSTLGSLPTSQHLHSSHLVLLVDLPRLNSANSLVQLSAPLVDSGEDYFHPVVSFGQLLSRKLLSFLVAYLSVNRCWQY